MGPFEMVVIIVCVITAGKIIGYKMGVPMSRSHRRDFVDMPPAQDAEVSRLRDEVSKLAQRVQTLEKLAVDPAARLADDIERLRDARN
jgi:hypothetical protein